MFFGVFAVSNVPAAILANSTPDTAFHCLLALVAGLLVVRGIRSGEVIQTEDRVIVRQLQWTHSLPRAGVSRFTVESGPIWPRWRSGSFLVAELKDGRLRAFKELSEQLGGAGEHRLEEVAASLNSAWHLRG